jgi:hypothetical protein
VCDDLASLSCWLSGKENVQGKSNAMQCNVMCDDDDEKFSLFSLKFDYILIIVLDVKSEQWAEHSKQQKIYCNCYACALDFKRQLSFSVSKMISQASTQIDAAIKSNILLNFVWEARRYRRKKKLKFPYANFSSRELDRRDTLNIKWNNAKFKHLMPHENTLKNIKCNMQKSIRSIW